MLHVTTSEREPIHKAYSTDIWLIGSDGSPGPRPWFETPFHESAASFSPDGKWIAYV
jgi:Tol biopolymer transport system component